MPEPKVQYQVEITRTGSGAKEATDALQQVDKAAQSAGKSVGTVAAGFSKLALAIGGAAFLRASVQEFIESERATAKLNVALKGIGETTPEVSKELSDLAESLSKVTQFSDEAIKNVIAKLLTFGASTKDVGRLTQAVLDLSTLMDKDLNRAVLTVGAAMRGEFGQFAALGFKINEAKTATAQFNELLTQVETKAGKGAQEAIAGIAGELERAEKATEDFKKAVGSLVTAFGPFLQLGTEITNKVITPIVQLNAHVLEFIRLFRSEDWLGYVKLFDRLTNNALDSLGNGTGEEERRRRVMAGVTPTILPPVSSSPPAANVPASIPGPVTTAALKDADVAQARAMLEKLTQQMIQAEQTSYEASVRFATQRQQNNERFIDQQQQWQDELKLSALDGEARVAAQIEIDHERRVAQIRQTKVENEEQYDALLELEQRLYNEQKRRHQLEQTAAFRLNQDLRRIAEQGVQLFSQGLAGAIVDAFEQGDKAFQAFARSFLRTMAQMILQAVILRAVQSGISGIFGSGSPGSGSNYSGSGVSGLQSVAGQGGSFTEFSSLSGRAIDPSSFSASLGAAHRSIAPPPTLAGAGASGGHLVIEVAVGTGAEARIVKNAVERSVARVTREMGQHGRLSDATKRLTI